MPSPVVHFEIGVRNSEKARAFYGSIFDWKFEAFGSASMVGAGGGPNSIGGHLNSLGHEPHNYVTVYIQVDDIAKCLKRIGENGGKTVVPPHEIPNLGHFAWFQDPEGNLLGLWKPLMQ